MADTITFLPKDDEGKRILDAFEQRTNLHAEVGDDDGARVFPLAGADHRVEVVETLNEIDAEWPHHIALRMPA